MIENYLASLEISNVIIKYTNSKLKHSKYSLTQCLKMSVAKTKTRRKYFKVPVVFN